MLAATRLTYRINRFEVRAVLVATILSVVVSAIVVGWIESSGYAKCIVTDGSLTTACLELQDLGRWATRIASISMNLAPFFPFIAGILLGVPIVAREIDRGTARLAWSLSPSRMRWLLQRLVPMILLVGVTSMVIGFVADRLVGIFAPGTDLSQSFVGFHSRGVLLATSAIVLGSAAVFVGAVVGKQMPTLILALILGGGCLLAVSEVHRRVMFGEAVPHVGENFTGNELYIDYRFQLPDGTLRTWDELVAIDPSVMENGPNYPYVQLEIPGSRYREVEAREAIVHLGLTAIFLALGGFVVMRRRPG